MMILYRFFGFGLHIVDSSPTKMLQPFNFWGSIYATRKWREAKESEPMVMHGRLAQLDAVSEKKPQAARQSTDSGPDRVSSGRNPWQRVGSRSHNSADVQVHRANILSLPTDPKRLLPLSKKETRYFGGSPKGLRYAMARNAGAERWGYERRELYT